MDLWQCHCRNRREKNCYNWFVAMPAKIGGKKFVAIVAMPLPKMGGKKKLVVAEIWGGIKKKSATFTIFLQQITCD